MLPDFLLGRPSAAAAVPSVTGLGVFGGGRVAAALLAVMCLILAGCTQPSSDTDDNRRGGFYGGISGGMN